MSPGRLPTDKGRKCANALWRAFKVHIGPIILFLGFTFAGAAIFEHLEGQFERDAIVKVNNVRQKFLEDIYELARSDNLTSSEWKEYANTRLSEFETLRTGELQPAFPLEGTDKDRLWTFWGAALYCGTIYTTIGYGLMCPKTVGGRVATIIYAMLGIPLCMIILANLGKLMALALRKIHWLLWKLYKYTKKAGSAAGNLAGGAAKGAMGGLKKGVGGVGTMLNVKSKSKSSSLGAGEKAEESDEMKTVENDHILNADDSKTDLVDSPLGSRDGSEIHLSRELSSAEEPELQIFEDAEDIEESEEDISPSVLFPIAVLIVYILLGAWMYSSWETWGYFESSYFIVISLSTIGLGDISPTHPKFFMASSIYILFGLTLVSFVINVILLALKKTIAKAQKAPGRFMAISKRYKPGKREDVVVEQIQNGGQEDNVKVSIADDNETREML